jgi:hypothetical protein
LIRDVELWAASRDRIGIALKSWKMRRHDEGNIVNRLFAAALVFVLGLAGSARAEPAAGPPDIAVVRADLAGTWQSTDDTKFTRELDADGHAADRYEGDASETTAGHWSVFLGSAAPANVTGRKFVPNGVYLKLDQNGDQLLFGLVGLSRSELKMIYLERGNLLSFVRLK